MSNFGDKIICDSQNLGLDSATALIGGFVSVKLRGILLLAKAKRSKNFVKVRISREIFRFYDSQNLDFF